MSAPSRTPARPRRRAAGPWSVALAALVVAIVSASVLGACDSDPVLTAQIKALGDEIPGIPAGEYHRAGQPCLVCHSPSGPGKGEFSIAGTVFAVKGGVKGVGVENVEVRIADSNNAFRVVKTNCVGNFFIGRTQTYYDVLPWDPAFPVVVSITGPDGQASQDMKSLINREGSCAGCHRIPAGLDSAGHVYLYAQEPPGGFKGATDCPVSPEVNFVRDDR